MKKNRVIKILNEIQPPYEIVALSCKQGVCRLEIINTAENMKSNLFNKILRIKSTSCSTPTVHYTRK